MKIIGIEEHITRDGFDQLEQRIKDMDEAGVDTQVLSCVFLYDEYGKLNPVEAAVKATEINDSLAGIIAKYPDRFDAFATLSLNDPETAAAELERSVKQLGLKGTMLYSNMGGEYLDNEKYHVIFQKAEELDVPVYLHPGIPSPGMVEPYNTYPILAGAAWGYAAEAGLHAMRLICGGVFDKYPGLKVILGHLGEAIPYSIWRIDNHWTNIPPRPGPPFFPIKLQKKPSEYLRDNFYVTTSGFFSPLALQLVISVLGADKVLFAVDYPPESAVEATQFIETAPISEIEREKICHLNAENLLKM